jgi:hypothetical protein
MKNRRLIIVLGIFVLLVSTACGFINQAMNQAEQIPSLAAKVATEVLTTVEAQITEVAPTIEAQMENLPTQAAEAQDSIPDFNGVPEEIIQKVFDRTQALESYRMDVTVTQDETVTSEMSYEVVNPDKIHVVINSDGTIIEEIIIGSKTYMKLGETWSEFPLDVSSLMGMGFDMYQNNIKNAKLIGPDTIDGTPMMVFEFSYDLSGSEYTSKMWVGLLDGYIHRTEADSVVDDKPYHTVTRMYDFNQPITIEAPIE